jgi:riboflavin biosynthesis pyrimidine reductase
MLAPRFESFEGLSPDEQSWIIAREYGLCNGWRVNFAVDQDGASFGLTGDSAGVSTQLDRLLLGKLRSLADVIVTSGETARKERYKSSKHAPIAIFSRTGRLDMVPAIQGAQYFTPLVLTPSSRLEDVESQLNDVDVRLIPYAEASDQLQGENNWPQAIASAIRHEGFQSPILESGLSTLRQFFEAEVISEVCLTVSQSRDHGLSARELSHEYLHELFGNFDGFSLAQLFVSNGASFSRWIRNGVALP